MDPIVESQSVHNPTPPATDVAEVGKVEAATVVCEASGAADDALGDDNDGVKRKVVEEGMGLSDASVEVRGEDIHVPLNWNITLGHRSRPITRSISSSDAVSEAMLPPVWCRGKIMCLKDEVDSEGNTLSEGQFPLLNKHEDCNLNALVQSIERDLNGFEEVSNDTSTSGAAQSCEVMKAKTTGKVSRRLKRSLLGGHSSDIIGGGTRSDPITVSSSSDTSSHVKGKAVLAKNRGNGSVASRFAAPKWSERKVAFVDDKFDPLNVYSLDYNADFDAWYNSPPKHKIITLATNNPNTVEPAFFFNLTNMRQWMSSLQCDVILFMLLLRRREMTKAFVDGWSIVESFFWNYAKNESTIAKYRKFMVKYANGKLPVGDGTPWKVIEHVYGIGNPFGNHFCAFDIHISKQEIKIYDSMCASDRQWAVVRNCFVPLAQHTGPPAVWD